MDYSNCVIRPATKDDALFIARGFHTAMLYEDTDEEVLRIFASEICTREDVLYSWRNTWIVECESVACGMLTAYDGAGYHSMRVLTQTLIKECLGTEFPGMEDESQTGEFYLDSLAVLPEHRGHGLGRKLLRFAIEKGLSMGLKVTLAVDPVNTRAQGLYRSLGFEPAGELFIFGHTYWKWAIAARG